MAPTVTCRVGIIGGGLIGLATAIGIRRAGHEVTVYEKNYELQEIGAGINIATNATKIFQHWGLLSALETCSIEPRQAMMYSAATNDILSRTVLNPDFRDEYGCPHLVVHRADILKVLFDAAIELGVIVRFGSSVESIDFERPSLHLVTGEVCNHHLILGADGERSQCREALIDHSDSLEDSGFDVYRMTLKVGEVIQDHELAQFVQPTSINLWVGSDSHAVTYPVLRDGLLNVVLTRPRDDDIKPLKAPQVVNIEEVLQRFSDWSPIFHRLISLGLRFVKRTMYHSNECTTWAHGLGKFALIGDAAHAAFPYLAQGGAMGFEDACVIGTLFSKLESPSQIPDVVKIYEQIRKPRALEARAISSSLKTLYTLRDGSAQQERDRLLLDKTPRAGSPNFFEDPLLRRRLYAYDAKLEAEIAWHQHTNGQSIQVPDSLTQE